MAGILFGSAESRYEPSRLNRRLLLGAAMSGLFVQSGAAARQDATPESSGEPAETSLTGLTRLLGLAPADLLDTGSGGALRFSWADIARQFAAVDVERASPVTNQIDPEPFMTTLGPLALASRYFQVMAVPEVAEATGLDIERIDAALHVGTPPRTLNVFQGSFPPGEIAAIWEAAGYERRDAPDGTPIWSLGDGIDFDSPIGGALVGEFNQAIIVEPDIVVFGPNYDDMVAVAALTAGSGSSLADEPAATSTLAAMPGETVSLISLNPAAFDPRSPYREDEDVVDALRVLGEVGADATPAPDGLQSFVIGITAGFRNAPFTPVDEGTPDASPAAEPAAIIPEDGVIAVRLLTVDEETAGALAATVVEQWESGTSLATNQPFTELMSVIDHRAIGPVAAVDFVPLQSPQVWIDLVLRQDLAPFFSNE